MSMRSPIISVLGHVDHGKSSILDLIRGSNIIATEAGAITQAIGASIMPLETLQKKAGKLLKAANIELQIPGLVFIDTPGHAAFTSLRKRGGALADIAILVIDINEGFKPQTVEAIKILRASKTPFVIAANKIDIIQGYKKTSPSFLETYAKQEDRFKEILDNKMYELVGKLHEEFQMESERFDRVDYTKQIAIVPCSAKEDVGVPELILVIAGLAQKFLEDNLHYDVNKPAKGTILEVKEEKGLGTTLDVIIYDGKIKVNDTVVIGAIDNPVTTKVRCLMIPSANTEMRDKRAKFSSVKEVVAAAGVKISAPDIKEVIAGMPVQVANNNLEEIKANIMDEIENVMISTDKEGIIVKADTIGSLEAIIEIMKEKKIPIRKAGVGEISKKDICEAEANFDTNPIFAVVLGFNVSEVTTTEKSHVITSNIIYDLVDKLEEWQEAQKKKIEAKQLDSVTRPVKVQIVRNCIFRQSNPCIVGVEVLAGTLKVGMPIMKDGKYLTTVKEIQADKKNVQELEKGKQGAISLPNITGGRQVEEEDYLFSHISGEDYRKLKKMAEFLTGDEKSAIKEITQMHRDVDPLWGV